MTRISYRDYRPAVWWMKYVTRHTYAITEQLLVDEMCDTS